MSGIYQYGNVSPLYVDAGCPTQCYANNEYSELNDYYGAVPIPTSTAARLFNTPLNINPNTYQIQGATQSIASGNSVAAANAAASELLKSQATVPAKESFALTNEQTKRALLAEAQRLTSLANQM